MDKLALPDDDNELIQLFAGNYWTEIRSISALVPNTVQGFPCHHCDLNVSTEIRVWPRLPNIQLFQSRQCCFGQPPLGGGGGVV